MVQVVSPCTGRLLLNGRVCCQSSIGLMTEPACNSVLSHAEHLENGQTISRFAPWLPSRPPGRTIPGLMQTGVARFTVCLFQCNLNAHAQRHATASAAPLLRVRSSVLLGPLVLKLWAGMRF